MPPHVVTRQSSVVTVSLKDPCPAFASLQDTSCEEHACSGNISSQDFASVLDLASSSVIQEQSWYQLASLFLLEPCLLPLYVLKRLWCQVSLAGPPGCRPGRKSKFKGQRTTLLGILRG